MDPYFIQMSNFILQSATVNLYSVLLFNPVAVYFSDTTAESLILVWLSFSSVLHRGLGQTQDGSSHQKKARSQAARPLI